MMRLVLSVGRHMGPGCKICLTLPWRIKLLTFTSSSHSVAQSHCSVSNSQSACAAHVSYTTTLT